MPGLLRSVGLLSVLLTGIPSQLPLDRDCRATQFLSSELIQERTVPSPDGQTRLVFQPDPADPYKTWLHLRTTGATGPKVALDDLSVSVRAKWAPDARAFYVHWSDSGAVGGFRLRVFAAHGLRATEMPTSRAAEVEFASKYPCETRGHNTTPIAWSVDSKALLLALEVYPSSDCGPNLGLLRGYLMRVSDGAILERYSERELKRLWLPGCPL